MPTHPWSASTPEMNAAVLETGSTSASWARMRDEMKAWLRAQGLPGDAVVMIGETEHEREMMTAGGLAGFLTGQRFFAGAADAV